MKKVIIAVAALSLCTVLAGAQSSSTAGTSSAGAFTLSVMPGVSFPLAYWNAGLPPGFYKLTPGAAIDVEYRLPFLPLLSAKAGVAYRRAPLSAGPVLSLIEASAGVGAQFALTPKISLKPYAAGGYHYGILALGTDTATGGAWTGRVGVNAQFDFFAPVGIVVGAAAVMDGGAFLGIQASIGASYSFGAPVAARTPVEKPEKTKPEKVKPEKLAPVEAPKIETKPTEAAGGLTLKTSFDPVFPVFQTWYDRNPLGTLTLKNGGKDSISGITVSFFMKQYMDAAVSTAVPDRLEPGKELAVPIRALFTPAILGIDTGTKAMAELTVDYKIGNDQKQTKLNASVSLEGRNGMNWIDDRRAAAFVTQKDQPIIVWARNVWSAVQGEGSKVIDENLRKAMAIHEAVRLFKMVYSKDPQTPYTGSEEKRASVDFLQFPRETLLYKAGDCDDLSILYCALLESLGVETAFITVPGHIYAAIALAATPVQARAQYKHPGDLILTEDKAWVPVEITKLGAADDFVEAWSKGATEWSDAQSKKAAALIPVRDAQSEYAAVNLPKDTNPLPVVPGSADLLTKYKDVTIKFLDGEMSERLAELNKKVKDTDSDPKALNALGVFYSKYGRYAEAKTQFKKATEKSPKYISPFLNLGMIALMENDLNTSLAYYQSAQKIDGRNNLALLGIARVNHDLENYGAVKNALAELKKVDQALATEFAYLELKGDEAQRAADISGAKEVAKWAEQ
jgi:tetratricopeptide (TPR) repeat protein